MTSFQKAQQLYHDDILKDIINQPKTTKNKNDGSDDNFWDIIQDEDDIPNNLNLSGYEKTNQKIDNNTKENDEKEKERIEILYNNLAKPKKEKINKINKPNNFNYTKKSKTLQPREGKKKRHNSVDINEDNWDLGKMSGRFKDGSSAEIYFEESYKRYDKKSVVLNGKRFRFIAIKDGRSYAEYDLVFAQSLK